MTVPPRPRVKPVGFLAAPWRFLVECPCGYLNIAEDTGEGGTLARIHLAKHHTIGGAL